MQRTASKIRTIAGQGMLLEEPMQCDQEVVRLLDRRLLRQLAADRDLDPEAIQSFVVRLPCRRANQLSRAII